MATRGFLIRFIDIGLIVLFGFLMISDIEMSSRVELAGATREIEEQVSPDDTRAILTVVIEQDGAFVVSDSRDPNAALVRVRGGDALTEALGNGRARHVADGVDTVVLIEPDLSSAVQYTVDVMDACDRLSLAKSLRMDIEIEAPRTPGAP